MILTKSIKKSEPGRKQKRFAWHTATGLLAVDGLKTSEYLPHIAACSIEGKISFDEVNALLQSYYEEKPACDVGERKEEADRVSARIAAFLSEKAFSLTSNEFLSIHRKLSPAFFLTPDVSGSLISPKGNGYWMATR